MPSLPYPPSLLAAPKEQKHKPRFPKLSGVRATRFSLALIQAAREKNTFPSLPPEALGAGVGVGAGAGTTLSLRGVPGAPRRPGHRIPPGASRQLLPPSQLASVREAWMTRSLQKNKQKKP